MSGGHFNDGSHTWLKVLEFTEELGQEIQNNGTPNEYGEICDFSDETIEFLRERVKELEKVGHLMRHIDKLYSGDCGEESFMERCGDLNTREGLDLWSI